jgi:hypothetical protein
MAVITVLAALLATPVVAAPSAKGANGRYLVVARSAGAKVLREIPQIKALVVSAPASARSSLAADRRPLGVARDRLHRVTVEDPALPTCPGPGRWAGPGCGCRPRRRPPGRPPGSTRTRPSTTRACSGTTGASACPRAGRPPPAAPR